MPNTDKGKAAIVPGTSVVDTNDSNLAIADKRDRTGTPLKSAGQCRAGHDATEYLLRVRFDDCRKIASDRCTNRER
jgi:hypothetical protein